jgi:hypothetical protein
MKLVRARWPFVAEMKRGSGESFRSTWISLRLRQFLDERLRVSQIRGSQSLGKTTVNRIRASFCLFCPALGRMSKSAQPLRKRTWKLD